MASIKETCAIVGIGETPYIRGCDKSVIELHLEASLKALDDAGLSPKDIDSVMPSSIAGTFAEQFILNLGIEDLRYSISLHQGGAGVGGSVESACLAITLGHASCVLVAYGRLGYSAQRVSARDAASRQASTFNPAMATWVEFEHPYGNVHPAYYFSQMFRRHMIDFGTKPDCLGHIALACRKHANLNPKALMYQRTMTMEDYLNSRMITDVFHLFDASLESDGAGAFVITSAERARDLKKRPILIMSAAQGHPRHPTSVTEQTPITGFRGIQMAAKKSFAIAGLTPKDIDFAEIYDGYTWVTLCGLEGCGFCKVGEGGSFVEGGRIELGGELPVNTHGGLVSEAHQSGVNHMIEAVRQLRHEVEIPERQVKDAEIGLVTSAGDFGDGAVTILRRS